MKIGLNEDTARKTLALLPADTTDNDLKQLRDRLEGGLRAATAAGHLGTVELEALIVAAESMVNSLAGYTDPVGSAVLIARRHVLVHAIPKLQALRLRRVTESEGGG